MESIGLLLERIGKPLFDAVFPRYCVSCKEEGELLCRKCFDTFDDYVFKEDAGHLTMFAYGNPVIRDLIKAYKYSYDGSALRILERLAEPKKELLKSFIGNRMLVPVPLSSLRLRERGFNQADEIARWLGRCSGSTIQDLLKREERAGHQADKDEEGRRRAMEKSPFLLKEGKIPEQVVLVDDVWTTGSTVKAAERVLKVGGVKEVRFLTLAKG